MGDVQEKQLGTGRRQGIFTEDAFRYDAETDTYFCPAGETMKLRQHKKDRRVYEYAARGKVCGECALRECCTRAKSGRSVYRHEDHEAVMAARAQSHSAQAKRDRRQRKWLMEGSFADAAGNHGFKRSRWRGLKRQRIQDYLIAMVQNVRILLRSITLPPRMVIAQEPALGGSFRRIIVLCGNYCAAFASLVRHPLLFCGA
jgi:hypothetical protein